MTEVNVYHPFNRVAIAEAPTKWTAELVGARLVEAMKVMAVIVNGAKNISFGNGWPSILHTFEDHLGRGAEARSEVWASWSRIKPSYDANTVQRSEEAVMWAAQFLKDDPRAVCVLVWATCKAANRPIEREFRRRGISAPTARRQRLDGLTKIADGLNSRRVLVVEAKVVC